MGKGCSRGPASHWADLLLLKRLFTSHCPLNDDRRRVGSKFRLLHVASKDYLHCDKIKSKNSKEFEVNIQKNVVID